MSQVYIVLKFVTHLIWLLKSKLVSLHEVCPRATEVCDVQVDCACTVWSPVSDRLGPRCYLIPPLCLLSTGFISSDSPAVFPLSGFYYQIPLLTLCSPFPLLSVFRAFPFNAQTLLMLPKAPLPCGFTVTRHVHLQGCASELYTHPLKHRAVLEGFLWSATWAAWKKWLVLNVPIFPCCSSFFSQSAH